MVEFARQFLETMMGLSGKAATGTATFVFLCLAVYSTAKHGDITDNVLYGFVVILGGYTAHSTLTQMKGGGKLETKKTKVTEE